MPPRLRADPPDRLSSAAATAAWEPSDGTPTEPDDRTQLVDVEVLEELELVEAMVMAIGPAPLASPSFSNLIAPPLGPPPPTPTVLGPLVGTATPAACAAA